MIFTKQSKSKTIVYNENTSYKHIMSRHIRLTQLSNTVSRKCTHFLLLFGLSVFALGGCVKYVDVPVWVCPSPTLPIKPEPKYKTVDKNDIDLILKAFIYDLKSYETYSNQLETLLKGYIKK